MIPSLLYAWGWLSLLASGLLIAACGLAALRDR
jgi:hypothetical protein